MFSEAEARYLKTQPLARLATVAPDGQPTVDAVVFQWNGTHFIISGRDLRASRKYKNVAAGNPLVSLIIDDLASRQPWTPRGIRVHGRAEAVEQPDFGSGAYLAIRPTVTWSWGLGEGPMIRNNAFVPRKTVWASSE